jgi:hypothetical protein
MRVISEAPTLAPTHARLDLTRGRVDHRAMRPIGFGRPEDRERLDSEEARVVPVGPVVLARGGSAVALVAGVALVVGTIAFAVGLQVGAVRPPDTSRPAIVASAGPSIGLRAPTAPASTPPVARPGWLRGPPYTSALAETFRPPDQFARFVGGPGCVSHNEQSEEAVGVIDYVLARTWTTFCSGTDWRRSLLVSELTDAIARQMPGSQTAANIATDGTTLVMYPYTEDAFIGSVTLSAANVGSGFQIVISLRERRAP